MIFFTCHERFFYSIMTDMGFPQVDPKKLHREFRAYDFHSRCDKIIIILFQEFYYGRTQ